MYFENHLIIEGRLTEKPELKSNKNGKNYCQFSMCYNQYRRLSVPNAEGKNFESIPNFFRVTTWNKEAVYVSSLNKGDPISVIGKLNYSEWKDEKGEKRNTVSIVAFHVRKLDASSTKIENQEEPEITEYVEMPVMDEEIPIQEGLF